MANQHTSPPRKQALSQSDFSNALIMEINAHKPNTHRIEMLLLQNRNHVTTDLRLDLIKRTIDKRLLTVLMLFDHNTVTTPEVLTYALQQKAWSMFRYCFHQSRRNEPSIESIITTLNGDDEDTYQLANTLLEKPSPLFSPLIVALAMSLKQTTNKHIDLMSEIQHKTNQRLLHPDIIRELESSDTHSSMRTSK